MAEPPAPGPVEDALRRADAARRTGRWKEAEAAYQAAWDAAPRPEIAGELGLCELSLGRYRDAAEHLERSLEVPEALTPAQRVRFEQGQGRAEREVVTVALSVSQPEAEVFLDDRPLGKGKGSYVAFVEPGRHAARAQLSGYAEQVYRFEGSRGHSSMVGLHLEPLPKPAPPRALPVALPPQGPVVVAPGAGLGPVIRVSGAAVAGAGVVVGVVLAIAATERGSVAKEQAAALRVHGGSSACVDPAVPGCVALKDTLTDRDILTVASVASFATGGLVGIFAVSSLWWAPTPRRDRIQVVPQATAQGGGVNIRGVW